MDGLDVKLEQVHNHVREQTDYVLTFKAVFAHTDSRRVLFDTNFVEQISPRVKDTIDAMFEAYVARVTTTPTSSHENSRHLGASRRVIHLEHFVNHTCSVCQSNYVVNEFVRTLPICKHIFHKRCIDPWIKRNQNPTCPVCREPIFIHTSSEHNESHRHARPSAGRPHPGPSEHADGSTPVPSSTEGDRPGSA